jgi:hypothetical protein
LEGDNNLAIDGECGKGYVDFVFCFSLICLLEVIFNNNAIAICVFDNAWHSFCV